MSSVPPKGPSEDEDALIRERREQMRASAIGLQFVISIAIGAFGGQWLDNRFGTTPWLLVLGLALGAAAAFRDMYFIARRHDRQADRNDKE